MRRRWRELLISALAVAGVAARSAAAEPDPGAPSVCAPPCPEGEICVGNRCQRPTEESPATLPRLPDRQSPPPPPPGSAPTTGPQPATGPDASHPPTHPDATPPPAPPPPRSDSSSPPAPPRLAHDAPPGTTYRPGTYAPQPMPRLKPTYLALPFLGIHSHQHEEASAYAPGLRLGALLGGRLSDRVSLNGEIAVEFSNVRGASSGFSERAYHFAFSPLFDVSAGPLQVVFGPKLGVFMLHTEQATGDLIISSDVTGVSAGFNGGLFLPVSAHTSIGLLLSFVWAGANQGCLGANGQGFDSCGSPAAHGARVLGLTGGVLF